MSIWYPKSLYSISPIIYFLIGLVILVVGEGFINSAIACLIFAYVGYILFMRLIWKGTGHVN